MTPSEICACPSQNNSSLVPSCCTHILFLLANAELLHLPAPLRLLSRVELEHGEPASSHDGHSVRRAAAGDACPRRCLLEIQSSGFELAHGSSEQRDREDPALAVLVQLPGGGTRSGSGAEVRSKVKITILWRDYRTTNMI